LNFRFKKRNGLPRDEKEPMLYNDFKRIRERDTRKKKLSRVTDNKDTGIMTAKFDIALSKRGPSNFNGKKRRKQRGAFIGAGVLEGPGQFNPGEERNGLGKIKKINERRGEVGRQREAINEEKEKK